MLNGRKNSPLVFDAAGKCILCIYGDEDMMERNKHVTAARAGSSKGKRSAHSVPKRGPPPKKKRQVVYSDDNDDEPLVSKSGSAYHHDQSTEGGHAFYYPYLIPFNAEIFSLEIDMQLNLSDSE